jgi:hypothetical protein
LQQIEPEVAMAVNARRLAGLFGAGAAATAVAGAGVPALAAQRVVEQAPATPQGSLSALRSNPQQAIAPAEFSDPHACYGQTDNAHHSKHEAATVNVVARTKCKAGAADEISVTTQLYRQTSTGWTAVGNRGTDTRFASALAQANSAATCVNGNYRGKSSHYTIEFGTLYTANTIGNVGSVTDCP